MSNWWESQVFVRRYILTSPAKDIVYHRRGEQEKTFDADGNHVGWIEFSHCRRLVSESAFDPYRWDRPYTQLHLDIARLFARPCKQCYGRSTSVSDHLGFSAEGGQA